MNSRIAARASIADLRRIVALRRTVALGIALSAASVIAVQVTPAHAQAQIDDARMSQAQGLISQALTIAERNPAARIAAVRGSAALIPSLTGSARDNLSARFIRQALSPTVPRAIRSSAFSAFFDVASHTDVNWTRNTAGSLIDPAARAAAYIDLSEVTEPTDWRQSNELAIQAQRSARLERNPRYRARALTFVALRMATLNPETRLAAVQEATGQNRLLARGAERDYLLAETVGAAAKFDLGLARRITAEISDGDVRNLAQARINMSEVSQTTLTASTSDRIAALAKASVRYDLRAIPILIQLPPQTDVLTALADALPPIYPTARPAIDANLLERMWEYSNKAEASVQKDQLQSRLARQMILHDLWRGRAWGKQLAWRGGRVQVGAFLKAVAAARRSQLRLRAEPLQDIASKNPSRAIAEANTLAPSARVEALLLIAGQILNPGPL